MNYNLYLKYRCEDCNSVYRINEVIKEPNLRKNIRKNCKVCGEYMYPRSLKIRMRANENKIIKDINKALKEHNEAFIVKCFNSNNEEYLKFHRIPTTERLHGHSSLCGLMYIHDRLKSSEDFTLKAHPRSHYLLLPKIKDLNLVKEDIIYLLRCGITYNTDNCLCMGANK